MKSRTLVFSLVLLALTSAAASAQQAIAGSTFWFDHSQTDFDDTERYELCVDTVSDASCQAVGVVLATAGTPNTYRFTLPATVPRGNHSLSVRAIGKLDTGPSEPSNALSIRIIGKPGPPTTFRQAEAKP